MEKKRSKGVVIAGIILIIIFLFPLLRSIIITTMALHRAEFFTWKLLCQYTAISFKPFMIGIKYIGLNSMLDNISYSLPLRYARTFNYLALVIMYLPYVCHIALFISGIGLFKTKEKLRATAVISLLVLLYLNIINTFGMLIHQPVYSLTPILFISLIFYLTRPKVKEQFR